MRTRFQSYSKPLCKLTSVLLMYAALQIVYSNTLPFLHDTPAFGGEKFISTLFPYNGMTNLLPLCLLAFSVYTPKQPVARWEKGFSWVCATMWLFGYSFNLTDDWELLFGSPLSAVCSVVAVLGGGIVLQYVLRWIKSGVAKLKTIHIPESCLKHSFLKAWALIFIYWLPFLIFRYPAGIEFDAFNQVRQTVGLQPLTANNPLLSTLYIGVFVRFGTALGSNELGIFLCVFVQALISSAILSYTAVVMRRLGVRPIWCAVSVLIYSLAPVYPNYLTALVKDALFSAFVVLFTTMLTEFILAPNTRSPIHFVFFGIVTLLVCLLRTNGIIWIVGCMVLLALIWISSRKTKHIVLAAILACACLFYSGYNEILEEAGIASASAGEPLSLPFQQTARYVSVYPEDITEQEADVLRAVLNYDHLAELYNPNVSDPVKGSFTGNDEALQDYFAVWFKHFLRHPSVYFEATLNNVCGFYYPFVHTAFFYSNPAAFHHFDNQFELDYPTFLSPFRTLLKAYIYTLETAPLLMLADSAGFQTWIILYLIAALIATKNKKVLCCTFPALIGIFVCICCPTFIQNGVRYALPYIYTVPLLLGITVFKTK